MSFEIVLRSPKNVIYDLFPPPSAFDYDSVVMDSCSRLASTDCFFRVGGFGLSSWPVEVGSDLSVFIEQLPQAIEAIEAGRDALIDLYVQGLERSIYFEVAGCVVRIRCVSRTSWVPNPDIEIIRRNELLEMLKAVSREFADSLDVLWPNLVSIQPIRDMLRAGSWDPSFLLKE